MPSTSTRDHRDQYQHVNEVIENQELVDDPESDGPALHLASVAEKKRLWWRNALITGACIALWLVFVFLSPCEASHVPQVFFCDTAVGVQQMDVLARPLRLPISVVRHLPPHVDPIRLGGGRKGALSHALSSAREANTEAIRVSVSVLCEPCSSCVSHSLQRQKVAPTALATCMDIGLSNLSLKTITLTFYSASSGVPFLS